MKQLISTAIIYIAPKIAAAQPESSRDKAPPAAVAPIVSSHGGTDDATASVSPPVALDVSVTYPEHAVGKAVVQVELLIDADGTVAGGRALQGKEPFVGAALAASSNWRFRAAQQGNRPRAARITISIEFSPPAGAQEAAKAQASTSSVKGGASKSTEGAEPPEEGTTEIVVTGERSSGSYQLDAAEMQRAPGAFGDPFRAIDTLPGVSPVLSGVPYFYLRGAPPGNVGYYLEGVPVPVLFHFVVGPGIVHPALLKGINVMPGAYPASWGGFTGGIVSGELKEPAAKPRGQVSVRLIDAGALVERPFAGGNGSIAVGGRYSYPALAVSLLTRDLKISYWDYQVRAHYNLGHADCGSPEGIARDTVEGDGVKRRSSGGDNPERDCTARANSVQDSLTVFWFGSADVLKSRSGAAADYAYAGEEPPTGLQTQVDLAFHRLDLVWRRRSVDRELMVGLTGGIDTSKLYDATIAATSQLLGVRTALVTGQEGSFRMHLGAEAQLWRRRQRFAPRAFRSTGYTPEAMNLEGNTGEPPGPALGLDRAVPGDGNYYLGFGNRYDSAAAIYGSFSVQAAPNLSVTSGVRVQSFTSGHDLAVGVEPRVSAKFTLTPQLDVVHAIGYVNQPPSFQILYPGVQPTLKGGLQRALQHSVTADVRLGERWFASASCFQHLFFNFSDTLSMPTAVTGQDAPSMGRSVGAELLLRGALLSNLDVFATYTLSRSQRSSGRFYGAAPYDRMHVLNIAVHWAFAEHWDFGTRGLFYTGIPATFDTELRRSAARTEPFWRLDWRLKRSWALASGTVVNLVAEVQNTTLNTEMVNLDCAVEGCYEYREGPITLPMLGVEVLF